MKSLVAGIILLEIVITIKNCGITIQQKDYRRRIPDCRKI